MRRQPGKDHIVAPEGGSLFAAMFVFPDAEGRGNVDIGTETESRWRRVTRAANASEERITTQQEGNI